MSVTKGLQRSLSRLARSMRSSRQAIYRQTHASLSVREVEKASPIDHLMLAFLAVHL